MRKVGDLSTLHEKYFARGFRVVATSSEPIDLLRRQVVEKLGAKYWVGSDNGRDGIEAFIDGNGGLSIPHYVLVDARGKVVGHDVPDEEQIERLLESVLVRDVGRDLHQKLAAARACYDAGAYGAAFTAAKNLQKDPDAAVVADAGFLIERIEVCAKHDKDRLLELPQTEQPEVFVKALLAARLYEGHPLGVIAQESVKKRETTPGIKPHRAAFTALDKALRQEIRSISWPSERKAVEKAYEELLKKHAGVAAATARTRLDALKKLAPVAKPAATPGQGR
jgi:hypothetical protein